MLFVIRNQWLSVNNPRVSLKNGSVALNLVALLMYNPCFPLFYLHKNSDSKIIKYYCSNVFSILKTYTVKTHK